MDVRNLTRLEARGKDAMAFAAQESHRSRPGQLWQVPLLLFSVGLFSYAAYRFIDPKSGPRITDRFAAARAYLDQDRPGAAIEQLNTLASEESLKPPQKGKMHLMLAEALERAQRQMTGDVPVNYQRMIDQTELASATGIELDADAHRRVAQAADKLGKSEMAIRSYRRAMVLDPAGSLKLQRRLIELLLESKVPAAADAELQAYLLEPDLASAERAWALGRLGQMKIDQGKFLEAKQYLSDAERLAASADIGDQGIVSYRIGYAAWKIGDDQEAEHRFRIAREQLGLMHPLDAEAAYALGEIARGQRQFGIAASLYQTILVSHPGERVMPLARIGRGLCRLNQNSDDAAMEDLTTAVKEILANERFAEHKPIAIAALQQAETTLASRDKYAFALELLSRELSLAGEGDASMFTRLAINLEKRADQLQDELGARPTSNVNDAESLRTQQKIRTFRIQAGDAWSGLSKKLVMTDDAGYSEALWKAIDLYDRAGDTAAALATLELFAAERPTDPQTAEALYRMGRAYQSQGRFPKAAAAFAANQNRFPQSLPASKSAVPLAQVLIAQGPDFYNKAEETLERVIDNNLMIAPSSTEFRGAIFELGQLYYRTRRYNEAIAKFEEYTERYGADEKAKQVAFLTADSYRQRAMAIEDEVKARTSDRTQLAADRAQALALAKQKYDDVLKLAPGSAELEKLYEKLAYYYRADCAFDLGNFSDAIKLYDDAALRYKDDAIAVSAFMQIVSCYKELGNTAEANTAAERVKVLMRRMPREAFQNNNSVMSRDGWERWLSFNTQEAAR